MTSTPLLPGENISLSWYLPSPDSSLYYPSRHQLDTDIFDQRCVTLIVDVWVLTFALQLRKGGRYGQLCKVPQD